MTNLERDGEQELRTREAEMRGALERAYLDFEGTGDVAGYVVRWDEGLNRPVVEAISTASPLEEGVTVGLALPSSAVRFSGLHAGAQIFGADLGAVACLLTADGVNPTHLLTAGHLFTRGAKKGQPVLAARAPDASLVQIGRLERDFLDEPPEEDLDRGVLSRPMDAALVKLGVVGRALARASRDKGVRIARIVSAGGLDDTVGRVHLTMRAGETKTVGLRFDPALEFEVQPKPLLQGTSTRAPYVLTELVRCELVTEAGDSGTLVDNPESDPPDGVGLCVGSVGRHTDGGMERLTVFETLDRVLGAVRQVEGCEGVEVWS